VVISTATFWQTWTAGAEMPLSTLRTHLPSIAFSEPVAAQHVFGQFLEFFCPTAGGDCDLQTIEPSRSCKSSRRNECRCRCRAAIDGVAQDKIERDLETDGNLPWFIVSSWPQDEHFVRRWWRFRQLHNASAGSSGVHLGRRALDAKTKSLAASEFVVIQGYALPKPLRSSR